MVDLLTFSTPRTSAVSFFREGITGLTYFLLHAITCSLVFFLALLFFVVPVVIIIIPLRLKCRLRVRRLLLQWRLGFHRRLQLIFFSPLRLRSLTIHRRLKTVHYPSPRPFPFCRRFESYLQHPK